MMERAKADAKLLKEAEEFYYRQDFSGAESCWNQILVLEPTNPQALYNLAVLAENRGLFTQVKNLCEQSLETALKSTSLFMDALDLLAHCHLREGDWSTGWSLYESRFYKSNAIVKMPYTCSEWDGLSFFGKRILVWAEQGLGDAIQFARFLPVLRRAGFEVYAEVHQELVELFTNSHIAQDCFFTGDRTIICSPRDGSVTIKRDAQSALGVSIHYQISMMSLARVLGVQPQSMPGIVPYLRPSENLRRQWQKRLEAVVPFGTLRVGLVWAGGSKFHLPGNFMDHFRSIELREFSELFKIPGISWISLQKGEPSDQVNYQQHNEGWARVGLAAPLLCWDLPGSLAHTAALIENLDLVIAVDTSVAHLAGALDKPVWLLNRASTCWRWMIDRSDTPWYPSMKTYRQTQLGDWQEVLRQVGLDLKALAVERLCQ